MKKWFVEAFLPTFAALALINIALYYATYRPALVTSQENLAIAQKSLQNATQQLALQTQKYKDEKEKYEYEKQQHEADQKRLDELRRATLKATSQFSEEVGKDIDNTLRPEITWEGKPHPTILEFAQKIVSDRDAARAEIRRLEGMLQHVSEQMDGDIDALNKLLQRSPPTSDAEMIALVRILSEHWNDKVRTIGDLSNAILAAAGCPRV